MGKISEQGLQAGGGGSQVTGNAFIAGGGANLTRVRAHNERLVLSLIRDEPLPRAEIARRTGLSAQTITLITRALAQDGLIKLGKPIRGKVGQPSVPLTLDANGAFFLGLKVGRKSAELIMMNFVGDIVLKSQMPYQYPVPDSIVKYLRCEIPSQLIKIGRKSASRLHGIGIAMPYEIWERSETLGAPKQAMELWRDFTFSKELASITDLPVFVENDATSACGAELTFGQGRRYSNFAYFFIGYFVGGGLALSGSIYRGHSGNAGAFGALLVTDEHSKTGTSQLIDTASINLLETDVISSKKYKEECIDHDASIWHTGSEELSRWLDRLASSLALAIVSVNSVVDVEVIVIDGGFPSVISERIVDSTQRVLQSTNTKGIRKPRIIAGTVGPDARALGAARLPMFSRFLLDETVLTRSTG